MAAFTPEFFERVGGFGLETERPMFIVGLPRSGTTLTEQILASHSQVFGAGELALAGEAFESLPRRMDRAGARRSECLGRLDRRHRRGSGRAAPRPTAASACRRRRASWTRCRTTTCTWACWRRCSRGPKFIHCRRDLRDVAVSCWMTNFRQHPLGQRPRAHRRPLPRIPAADGALAAVLPVPVLEVDYEETVADLEGVARRLVAWCGLEWEPACLDFHEARRPVRTASVTQVRQPIYTRSVARWKHYEQALAPLLARLEVGSLSNPIPVLSTRLRCVE